MITSEQMQQLKRTILTQKGYGHKRVEIDCDFILGLITRVESAENTAFANQIDPEKFSKALEHLDMAAAMLSSIRVSNP